MNGKQHKFLEAMALIEDISKTVGTTSYIWGGFTIDIYKGQFLRDHHDIDYLTVNLAEVILQVTRLLDLAGWQVKKLVNGDLSVRGNGLRLHLGNIFLEDQVRWTHNGANGSLLFPKNWLIDETIKFYNIDVHVMKAEFEYVVKRFPKLLNPEWNSREKDIDARRELVKILKKPEIDLEVLYSQVTTIC